MSKEEDDISIDSGEEDTLEEFYHTQKPEYFQEGLKDLKEYQQKRQRQDKQKLGAQQGPKNFIPYGEFEEDTFFNNLEEGKGIKGRDEEPKEHKDQNLMEYIQQIDQEHDSEDQGIQDYQTGGYHPVHIGQIIQGRYVIIQKIGWGHFSTVWLAKDFKYETFVALKIQKSAPHYLQAAYDEVEILQKVARKLKQPEWIKRAKEYHQHKSELGRDDCHIVQLLNSFIYRGPYGNHFCFVFQILGVNLLEVIQRYNYQGVPMHLCRKIAKQVLVGLDYLHTICGVIHTDLKPENVLLCLTQEEIQDIVENGELTKNTLFADRVAYIRKYYGLEKDEEIKVDGGEQVKLQPQNNQEEKKTDGRGNADLKEEQDALDQSDQEDEKDEQGSENNTTAETSNTKKLTKNQQKNLKKRKKKQKLREDDHQAPPNQDQNNTVKKETLNGEKLISQGEDHKNSDHHENQGVEQLFKLGEGQILEGNQLMRGPELDDNFRLQIADLGNACWKWHHFATEIQTRQYRSPEVIIQASYNETADVWSLACMLFEMLTGDFLFEPRRGPTFSKNDDHLAQICELTRKFPKDFAFRGEKSKRFFDDKGNMRKIPNLQFWSLENVLTHKYKIKREEARQFANFLMPMLNCYPERRATAFECLKSTWLSMPSNVIYKMTDDEYRDFIQLKKQDEKQEGEEEVIKFIDIDDHDADNQDNSYEPDSEQEDDTYKQTNVRYIQRKFIDRSFTDLGYIGYGDGIEIDQLDFTGNWQFSQFEITHVRKNKHTDHPHNSDHQSKNKQHNQQH